MANVAAPYGFRPVQERNGSPWCGKTREVIFLDTDATACFVGDLVKYTGTQVTDPETGITYSVVTKASAADTRLAGAVVGFQPALGPDWISYKRANEQIRARIPVDRDVIYSVQEDGDASFLTDGAAEANIDFVAGTGNTQTGLSTSALDSSTVNTTDTLPLRIISSEGNVVDNEVDGSNYVQWLVTINQDAYSDKTGL